MSLVKFIFLLILVILFTIVDVVKILLNIDPSSTTRVLCERLRETYHKL